MTTHKYTGSLQRKETEEHYSIAASDLRVPQAVVVDNGGVGMLIMEQLYEESCFSLKNIWVGTLASVFKPGYTIV